MSEGRRHSTRNRGEPPMKLRKVSPDPSSPKPDASAASPPTTGRNKVGRPSRKSDAKETPSKPTKTATSKTKAKDSSKTATPAPDVQEIPQEPLEDMSTLIEKSRQRWITEGGVFEKFWTKPPRKKKGQPAPDLPTKLQMNMVDVGPARLIIAPHVFDVHLWGVKKPALTWQPPIEASTVKGPQPTPTPTPTPTPAPAGTPTVKPNPVPQNPYVRPAPGATVAAAPATQQAPIQPAHQRGIAPNPYAMPNAPAQNAPAQTAVPTAQQSPVSTSAHQGPIAVLGNAPPTPAAPVQRPAPVAPVQQQQPQVQQPGAPHPDPVIQMLAQRAAGDPVLKELMKVVAAGSEDPGKLAEFQRHINEITEIVKQQQLAKARQAAQPAPAQNQTHQQAQAKQQQQFRSTQYIQSKPPAPPARVEYSQLAFDFIRQGDCYLFPSQSIIQHKPQEDNTLISFLFTRKGKDVPTHPGGSRLKPETDYYQPMTIQLLTKDNRIREAISQVVGKQDLVSKGMTEIMEKFTLAPDVEAMWEAASVSTRGKKRDADGVEKAGEKDVDMLKDEEEEEEDDVLKMEWDAPDSLLPL